MTLYSFLQSPAGLAGLYLLQAILFSLMVYILAAEYYRTRRSDLVYKLIACSSITVTNLATTIVFYLNAFERTVVSDRFFPLIFTSLFVIIVLALARAFIYDFVANKKLFDLAFRGSVVSVFVLYGVLQFYWLRIYTPDVKFERSIIQLLFSSFFITLLVGIIFMTLRYRKKYQYRLTIAFLAIIVVHVINIYGVLVEQTPGALVILRACAPLLVPTMFGSVVFKELIEQNVTMTQDLKSVLKNQNTLIHELDEMGNNLGGMSTTLFEKSIVAWERLTEIKSSIQKVENLSGADELDLHIRKHSRDIEEIAGLSDGVKDIIQKVNDKTQMISEMSDRIDYIEK